MPPTSYVCILCILLYVCILCYYVFYVCILCCVGALGEVEVAAHSALLSICTFAFNSFPFAISIAGTIRVGNLLGAGKPQQVGQCVCGHKCERERERVCVCVRARARICCGGRQAAAGRSVRVRAQTGVCACAVRKVCTPPLIVLAGAPGTLCIPYPKHMPST